MERTPDTIRAALAAIDSQSETAREYSRVASELRSGTAVIIGRQVGAGVRGRIGARLNAGVPLSKEHTAAAATELAVHADASRDVATTTNAALPHGESVNAYRTLVFAADQATAQAAHADTLLRHLRPSAPARILAAVLPQRRRYRATNAETKVMRHVLEQLADRHRNAAADATEALDPTGTLRLAK